MDWNWTNAWCEQILWYWCWVKLSLSMKPLIGINANFQILSCHHNKVLLLSSVECEHKYAIVGQWTQKIYWFSCCAHIVFYLSFVNIVAYSVLFELDDIKWFRSADIVQSATYAQCVKRLSADWYWIDWVYLVYLSEKGNIDKPFRAANRVSLAHEWRKYPNSLFLVPNGKCMVFMVYRLEYNGNKTNDNVSNTNHVKKKSIYFFEFGEIVQKGKQFVVHCNKFS